MIFNTQGVPLGEVLVTAALGKREADAARERRAGQPRLVRGDDGKPVYQIVRDKIGNVYRVFRAVLKQTGSGPYNKTQESTRRASHS